VFAGFDSWDEPYSKGPGLYIAVVADHGYDGCADLMWTNTWPVEDCRRIDAPGERWRTAGG